MRNSYQLRGNHTIIRNVLILLLLSFLPFLFCSKGQNHDPVVPSTPDNIYSGEGNLNTARLDVSSDDRSSSIKFDNRVYPIMPVEVLEKMEVKLTSIIGNAKCPTDQLIFLYASPDSHTDINPPLLEFAFIAPDKAITPDEITVSADRFDISKDI